MANDLLALLVWSNATLSVAILFVFALRAPVRRLAGARCAYALWIVPLLACVAWISPARRVFVTSSAADTAPLAPPAEMASLTPEALLFCWAFGCGAALVYFALAQISFFKRLGALQPITEHGPGVFSGQSQASPVVLGVLRPIIVVPPDFNERFSPSERVLILAHERTHIARRDSLVNSASLLVRCLAWFNPLIHIAAQALRADQELACDEAVLAGRPSARSDYAEAMLKSGAATAAPLVCAWPNHTFHQLKERIMLLKMDAPSRLRTALGRAVVLAASAGACGAVWLLRPAEALALAEPAAPVALVEMAAGHPAQTPQYVSAQQTSTTPTQAPVQAEPTRTLGAEQSEAPVGSDAVVDVDDAQRVDRQRRRCQRALQQPSPSVEDPSMWRLAALVCIGLPEYSGNGPNADTAP